MRKQTVEQLRCQLVNAEARAQDGDFLVRIGGRDDARKLKARIARREKDDAMRDLGLIKVRGALGGTYYE